MKKEITIEVDEQRLENRSCARCGHSEFFALKFIKHSQMVSCSLDCSSVGCGHLLRIGFHGEETRCGDIRETESASLDSQTTIPLAVCWTCGRLVSLF